MPPPRHVERGILTVVTVVVEEVNVVHAVHVGAVAVVVPQEVDTRTKMVQPTSRMMTHVQH